MSQFAGQIGAKIEKLSKTIFLNQCILACLVQTITFLDFYLRFISYFKKMEKRFYNQKNLVNCFPKFLKLLQKF